MKIKIILAALMLLSFQILAQDRKATALLNEVSVKTQSHEQIKIEFDYIMRNKNQNINEKIQGVLLSQDEKYRLEVAGQQIISDGKTMWTYLESVNEVQVNDATDEDDGFNPRSFLQNWSENFRAKIISENASQTLLELTPKTSSNFTKVHVTVDNNKKQLLSIIMFDSSGSEFEYSIRRFITTEKIPASSFAFNPKDYPGIEVIDLR
jgi:outer membrane lipoprotein-sorting protein